MNSVNTMDEAFTIESLPTSNEDCGLGVLHLKRFWAKSIAKREGVDLSSLDHEFEIDRMLLDSLGLGLNPTISYLLTEGPDFTTFEHWVHENRQQKHRDGLLRNFNKKINGKKINDGSQVPNELTSEQLDFFSTHGYIIIQNAIHQNDCEKTINAISDFLGCDLNNRNDWYIDHPLRSGIMVEFYNHAILEENRFAPKITDAFEGLWETSELCVSCDRVGVNPPETDVWKFSGPNLHLDVNLGDPKSIRFGLQGLLYLTDTASDQGAFRLIPGFHKKIDDWIQGFPKNEAPMEGPFNQEEAIPISAKAGDFIIWNQLLPHGSSPNHNLSPRIVQYITHYPFE